MTDTIPSANAPTSVITEQVQAAAAKKSKALTVLAALVGLTFVTPAIWIFEGSFRPNEELITSLAPLSWSLILPRHVSFANYKELLLDDGFGRALANSLFVCLVSVIVGLLISVLAAYALSVLQFAGRNAVFAIIVISFMVPFEAIAIPLSQVFTNWGLTNTFIGLILPGVGNGLAIFNLRQFFQGIPADYREAAKLDGASEPQILFLLYLRMSGPALANSGLLIFLGQWTAFLWPLLIVSDSKLQLAPVALASTFGEHSANYGTNFAGAIMLTVIPALTMFLLQRVFGRLSVASGVK